MRYLRISACAAAALAVAAAACSKGGNTSAANTGQDTTLTTTNGAVAQRPINDQPERRARRSRAGAGTGSASDTATAAASSASPAAAATVTLPSGTAIITSSNARVCTNTHHVGDIFTGNVTDAVMGSGGQALPSGSVVTFRVTQVKSSKNMTQAGQIGIAVDSIGLNGVNYPAEADITSAATTKVRSTSMGQEATKAGIGAAAGGILGQVIGHNAKSTIIGAAAGLAAGGATALATTKYDFCIPQNGRIALKLTADDKL